jgi:hypothetical protein
VHGEVRQGLDGAGDSVGEQFLVAADRGDVHQARGERGRVLSKI